MACPRCGFIFNRLFNASQTHYRPGYEDQQRFSASFNQFSADLVHRLNKSYRLAGRTVVEVGCGKGDFLVDLCTATGARGVGIDPAWQEGRTTGGVAGHARFIRDTLKPEHIPADIALLLCRHTLEHIARPLAFMRTVRDSVNEGTPVFIEVPDADRILAVGAFEDIYYEHCNYFTGPALQRLVERSGFAVRACYRVYDDQYLCLEAVAAAAVPGNPAQDSVTPTRQEQDAIARFHHTVTANLRQWQDKLAAWSRQGQAIAIWGSGSKCVAFLSALPDIRVQAIVDINPYRSGRYAPGMPLPIARPDSLRQLRPDRVILMNARYRREVGLMLRDMGLPTRLSVL